MGVGGGVEVSVEVSVEVRVRDRVRVGRVKPRAEGPARGSMLPPGSPPRAQGGYYAVIALCGGLGHGDAVSGAQLIGEGGLQGGEVG